MQLASAIEGWLSTHGRGLSSATTNDVRQIGAAVTETGYEELECRDLDESAYREIIDEAEAPTRSRAATREFLTIVSKWGIQQSAQSESATDDNLGVALDDANGEAAAEYDEEPELDDEELDEEPAGEYDDEELDEEPAGEYDDEELDEEPAADEVDLDVPEPFEADLNATRELTFADDVDDEDAVRDLFTATSATASNGAPGAFGSSIALGSDAESDAQPIAASTGGAFSAATVAKPPAKRFDWITIAWFALAAISFAGVVYLYLTG